MPGRSAALLCILLAVVSLVAPVVVADDEGNPRPEPTPESVGTSRIIGPARATAPPFVEGLDGVATKGTNWSSDPVNWTKTAAIKLRGSPTGETEARVKVRVEGKGNPTTLYLPQQTVILIQDSGTMATNDPSDSRLDGASTYIDQLTNFSEVALVKFPQDGSNSVPVLLRGLTTNYSYAKSALDPAMFNQTGSTPLKDALHMGRSLLVANRAPGSTQNIVLMSNGCFNTGGTPWGEVNQSKNDSVRIFTVGIYEGNGSSQKQSCEAWMQQWAAATGGAYRWMTDPAQMSLVHAEASQILTDLAGTPPANGAPMVSLKLTDDIEVVPGSFVCDPGKCADPAPDNASGIQVGNRGLFLNWTAPAAEFRIGEVWQVEFGIHSYTLGTGVAVNDAASSRVLYDRYNGSTGKGDKLEDLFVDVTRSCPSICLSRADIFPTTWTMNIGDTKQFAAAAVDQNNQTIQGVGWKWSVSGSAGTVNSTGFFTANAGGVAQVTAEASYNGTNRSASALVNVNDPTAGAPYVTSTYPASGATGVSPAAAVDIYWNESMDQASAEGAMSVSGSVSCAWSWPVATQQRCRPTQLLAPDTTYLVSISTAAKDSAGVGMKSPVSISFTTGGLGPPPTVVLTLPVNGAFRVSPTAAVQVMFSAPMSTAPTIAAVSFAPAAGTASAWSGGDTTLELTPSVPLLAGTRYTVTVDTGARSTTGVPMSSAFTLAFTTEPDALAPPQVLQSFPADGAAAVDPSVNLVLWFDHTMETSSTQAAFTAIPPINGNFFWNSARDRVEVKTLLPLMTGARYDVTLSTAATSSAGVRMAAEYRFDFSVAGFPDTTPPVITHQAPTAATEAIPLTVRAQVTDESGVLSVTYFFRKDDSVPWTELRMGKEVSTTYQTIMPAANLTQPKFEYFIEAWDTQSNSARTPVQKVSVAAFVPPPPDIGKAVGSLGTAGIAALVAAAGVAVGVALLLFWKKRAGKKGAAEAPPSFFSGLDTKGAKGPQLDRSSGLAEKNSDQLPRSADPSESVTPQSDKQEALTSRSEKSAEAPDGVATAPPPPPDDG